MDFWRSARISKVRPEVKRRRPRRSVRRMVRGRAVRGRALRDRTGRRQRVTQVAWAKKARRNLGGEVRIWVKRESVPEGSVVMRWKR